MMFIEIQSWAELTLSFVCSETYYDSFLNWFLDLLSLVNPKEETKKIFFSNNNNNNNNGDK